MIARSIVTLAVVAFVASMLASGAWAQGFTFGNSVSGDDVRAAAPDSASRRARAQTVQCRSERHQVYDAQGQMVWRTIRVCG